MKSIVADERDARRPEEVRPRQAGGDRQPSTSAAPARRWLLGGKAADDTVYARDTSKPVVVTVDSALADDLKKGADDYRRKDVFEFRAFNATRVEFTRDGQTVVLREGQRARAKTPRTSGGASARTPADVDKDKVDGLLAGLANMRAASFVDSTAKTGLDTPALTVAVKFDDGKKEERVTFGKEGADVYASRPGEPGAAKVDAADFAEANKTLDELSK